jgi:hypothetical protein
LQKVINFVDANIVVVVVMHAKNHVGHYPYACDAVVVKQVGSKLTNKLTTKQNKIKENMDNSIPWPVGLDRKKNYESIKKLCDEHRTAIRWKTQYNIPE